MRKLRDLVAARVDRREPWVLLVAVGTGIAVGMVVTAFEFAADRVLHTVLSLPVSMIAIAPGIGLALSALILRYLGGSATPSTSDEYVRAFHERQARLPLRLLPVRLLAGVTSIGFGASLGLEGPALYAGATIGTSIQSRLKGIFTRDEAKVLLVAGGAAAIAAVFRTPATGVIFALEAPYTADVARRALLPSMLASAASYATFTIILPANESVSRVVPKGTFPVFDTREVVGAVLVGLFAGLAAGGFARLVSWAKDLAANYSIFARIVPAAVILGLLAVVSQRLFDEPFTIGPGYEVIEYVTSRDVAMELVALLLLMRVVATITSLIGGGVGGLFIPLSVQGVLLGKLIGIVVGRSTSLFPILGLAAFLGAGYRTPLASVMFVAETTQGGGKFIVPALISAAVSQLVPGRSVSKYQRSVRLGHLERRFELPLTSVLQTDVLTVPPDATLSEFVYVHVLGRRVRDVPVVEDGHYLGMCRLDIVSSTDREQWDDITVGDVMSTDAPAGRASWSLRRALSTMERADSEILAVADTGGTFIGIVTESDILRLDELLDETGA